MKLRPLLILIPLAALPLKAQEKKPVKKPEISAEDRARLNAKAKELRNKEELKKALDLLDKKVTENKGAEKELERAANDDANMTSEDAKKRLKALEESFSAEDRAELKKALDAAKGDARAVLEQQREKMRRDQGNAAPAPLPEAPERPDTFDNIAPPAPLAPMQAVAFPPAPLSAEKFIKGPERDPKNPDVELPDTDIRRRTWIAQGTVRLRLSQQQMAVDADEVTILWKAGSSPGANTKSSVKDPLAGEKEAPFERLIAKGRVRVMFVDRFGRVQVGRGGYMIYDQKTGEFILKDWPEIQESDNLLRAVSKDASLQMNRARAAKFDGSLKNVEVVTLASSLTSENFPPDRATPIPDAGARKDTNKIP